MDKTKSKKKKQSNAEKPISLQPLKFDEAISDLLKVKPQPKIRKEEAKGTQISQS